MDKLQPFEQVIDDSDEEAELLAAGLIEKKKTRINNEDALFKALSQIEKPLDFEETLDIVDESNFEFTENNAIEREDFFAQGTLDAVLANIVRCEKFDVPLLAPFEYIKRQMLAEADKKEAPQKRPIISKKGKKKLLQRAVDMEEFRKDNKKRPIVATKKRSGPNRPGKKRRMASRAAVKRK
eukprot:TRINITY_DN49538_c0_g1_i1.p1 TRINITY_DN49538_c0_g1~~TRINITY_DN49538_c0_g1_i1.p1  ORF type:complete len:182 (+),score=72.57 TRINITY_DN49538_c0_g1_i1:86-631(+)